MPQEGGAAKGLWRFSPEPAFRAIWVGCPPRVGIQLRRYGTNVAKRGDFTFCLIHDFNSLRVAGTTTERVGLLTLADSTERFDPIALRSLGLARRNSFELLVKIIAARSHLLINVSRARVCQSQPAGRDVSNRA